MSIWILRLTSKPWMAQILTYRLLVMQGGPVADDIVRHPGAGNHKDTKTQSLTRISRNEFMLIFGNAWSLTLFVISVIVTSGLTLSSKTGDNHEPLTG
jgi:hypothetical protein